MDNGGVVIMGRKINHDKHDKSFKVRDKIDDEWMNNIDYGLSIISR